MRPLRSSVNFLYSSLISPKVTVWSNGTYSLLLNGTDEEDFALLLDCCVTLEEDFTELLDATLEEDFALLLDFALELDCGVTLEEDFAELLDATLEEDFTLLLIPACRQGESRNSKKHRKRNKKRTPHLSSKCSLIPKYQ